jgi:hypothetical protein
MTTPAFTTQLIGQTEEALNAILARLLADTAVTEPQWVTLQVALAGEEALSAGELTSRVAGVLKVSATEARSRLTELSSDGLLRVPEAAESPVTLTGDGHDLVRVVRAAVADITGRLWGDLPEQDLAAAGRVLGSVLSRANLELASA